MNRPTLHLLMGLPGSGKTTLAKHIQAITDAVRMSSDDFRLMLFPKPSFSQKEHDNLYAIIDHNVEHLLQAGHSVIYDANLNRRRHRDEKYTLAEKYNARVVLWWLQTPDKLSKKRRIADQNTILIPPGETPENMFDRIALVFEPPGSDETYSSVNGTEITRAAVEKLLRDHQVHKT